MIILGIESSCDETAAAVIENGTKVLSNIIVSSRQIHQKWGGIVPEQAAREQIKYIIPVIQEALKKGCGWTAGQSTSFVPPIEAIAVTVGPGLVGSLLVGIETAKTLSFVWHKPIVPVNHLLAHIYANFINKVDLIKFPALGLIVSGGHTQLVLMKNHGIFTQIGTTRDDAAGECFDKSARLLGFGYPGGPEIEKQAKNITATKTVIRLPRPMINENNFDFSFSGLKTAVFYTLKKEKSKVPKKLLAYKLQEAIVDILVKKTLKAAKKHKVKSILVGGGVAANNRLREKLQSVKNQHYQNIKLFIPNKKLCTDNAAIIATTAFFNYQPLSWSKIKANPALKIS